jgi:hypothetical protein
MLLILLISILLILIHTALVRSRVFITERLDGVRRPASRVRAHVTAHRRRTWVSLQVTCAQLRVPVLSCSPQKRLQRTKPRVAHPRSMHRVSARL